MNLADTPQTASIQELACFWDRHDLTDFKDQLEEISESVFERDDSGRLGPALDRSQA